MESRHLEILLLGISNVVISVEIIFIEIIRDPKLYVIIPVF